MAVQKRKKLALITTVWRWRSHSNHMGERFFVGYPRDGKWHDPEMDIVSAFVDQVPEDDLSRHRRKEHGFTIYPTITEALRMGTNKLAVDGVLLIAEHGIYPRNEKDQKLYPRYEFFEEIVNVFKEDGRSVPVFNDKHLSYEYGKAKQMVEWSKELDFPFLAGSSIPVTFRLPPLELPIDCDIEDALTVGIGGSDASDYHCLEALQAMVERRRGGETGVKAVQIVDGDEVWRAGDDGRWSWRLLEAALARSDSRSGIGLRDGRPQNWTHNGELQKVCPNPGAYFIEYNDGFRATLLMLNGAVQDRTFAAKLRGEPKIQSTLFLAPGRPNVTYSACLMQKVEEMIVAGRAPYPVERTLLVSGALERCLESRISDHRRILTPELDVVYRAPEESHFCGALM